MGSGGSRLLHFFHAPGVLHHPRSSCAGAADRRMADQRSRFSANRIQVGQDFFMGAFRDGCRGIGGWDRIAHFFESAGAWSRPRRSAEQESPGLRFFPGPFFGSDAGSAWHVSSATDRSHCVFVDRRERESVVALPPPAAVWKLRADRNDGRTAVLRAFSIRYFLARTFVKAARNGDSKTLSTGRPDSHRRTVSSGLDFKFLSGNAHSRAARTKRKLMVRRQISRRTSSLRNSGYV